MRSTLPRSQLHVLQGHRLDSVYPFCGIAELLRRYSQILITLQFRTCVPRCLALQARNIPF